MLRWIRDFYRGSDEVEFASSYGLQESVDRLAAATKRSTFSTLGKQAAVGTVKASSISLCRVIPMVGNSFKPFFRGHFIERDGKVFLVGGFGLHWFVKIFMTIWFSFVALGTIGSSVAVIFQLGTTGDAPAPAFPLFGMWMLAFGVALVGLGRWFSRNDVAWLSGVMRQALAAPLEQTGATSTQPPAPSSLPTYAAAVLGATGLLNFLTAFSDVQTWHSDLEGTVVTHFENPLTRLGIMGFGLLLVFLAWGVYRRSLLSWRLVLLAIALSPFPFILSMLTTQDSPPLGIVLFMGIGAAIVTVFWGRWWYLQREHFNS